MNIKQSSCLVALCFCMTYMASAQANPGTLVDKIIVNVDSQIILQSDLETTLQQYLAQGGKEVPDLKCKLLKQLIVNKVLLAKAKQEGVVVEKEIIEQVLSDEMQYFLTQTGSEEALVRHWGKPILAIKREVREKIEEQLTLDRMRFQLVQDISVTPKEVKAFFETLPLHERPYYPASVVVRQIVKYLLSDQHETDASVSQLKALKVRLQNGEDFGVLAKAYSQDPGSASQGGDLGFWKLGELSPAYEAAALGLQPGEISDPVITESGYHLIQLIAREKDRYSSRHILLKPKLDIKVAKAQLVQLREDILSGKITFAQAAKEYSDDSLTRPIGGLITAQEGGNESMLIDDLSPDVFFAIEKLLPGDISDPIMFSVSDEQEALRILLLEDRVAPHYANLAQDYAEIQQLLINKKQITALQAWFESVKAITSIRVAPEYQHCVGLN